MKYRKDYFYLRKKKVLKIKNVKLKCMIRKYRSYALLLEKVAK